MFDCYIASDLNNIKKYCVQLKQNGFTGVCFTEPVLFIPEKLKKVPQKLSSDIEILNGLDIVYEPETHEAIALCTLGSGVDVIINSVKGVDGSFLDEHEYYSSQSRNNAYSRYLEKVYDSLDAAYDYQLIGSLGYPSMHAYYPSPSMQYRELPEILDNILMRVAFTGKGLTVDSSLFPRFGETLPSRSILKRFRELGGEIVSVGSFAQQPEQAGMYIKAAHELLKGCGFDYTAVFRAGQPQMIKL